MLTSAVVEEIERDYSIFQTTQTSGFFVITAIIEIVYYNGYRLTTLLTTFLFIWAIYDHV